VQPGDLYRVIDSAKWLLHASHELGRLFEHKDILPLLNKVVDRVEKGVKAELLPLVKLKDVGRVRARALFNANLKTVDDLRRVPFEELTRIPSIGSKIAKKIKDQTGGFLKADEYRKLKKGDEWQQKAISEY